MMDAKDLDGREFFSFDIELWRDGGFFVSNGVGNEVSNNVWKGANVWVEDLVPICIRGCDYSQCVGVLFGCKAGLMDGLLEVRSTMRVDISNYRPFMVKC
ncbi:hypothetical protein M758_UG047800 [Ceratodon purpureus]|nr:hypothetical protein M758_UG047800 [Ceratodon purpureus]